MGLSESGHGCKNHPHHQEKQGVCPSCLRESLSRLCSASDKEANSRVAPSLSFSPADYSSALSSNPASPARHHNFHRRNGSGVTGIMGSSSFMVKVGTDGLKKSRSIAFVPRDFDDEEVKNGKKKKGFWSKLLRFKGKNKDVLTHSTSMRLIERVNLVW
ncbi:uncharacterized protein LOC111301026 [Durio zibethinus]|uniref:Uncharacterized protein LOC111301026 n=1 Tax=Durio zibethinus TaxID=66656 RepID=A0A6P5ZHE4_DURZI|nr:uncharacterized protein LOC111301026 [Durio zibethinus]